MSIIVQILHSAPSMNTRSKKKEAQQNPMAPQFGQGEVDSHQYFFTLLNSLNDNLFIHMVQQDTTMFDLQELTHEELVNHKQVKKDLTRAREFKRETNREEKLVRLKEELIRKTELGETGLIWRNQE